MNQKLTSLKYFIISGKPKNAFEIKLHNKAFNFWKENWDEIYNGKLKIDEFFRQDTLSMIMNEDKIIALHLYTDFNTGLESHLEHSYFCEFSDNFRNYLAQRDFINVTSAEYMTVARDYRGKGENIARILLYLTLNVFKSHGKETMIGPMNFRQGVTYLIKEAGGIAVESNVKYKDFMVDIGLLEIKDANLPPESIRDLVSKLWEERSDFSEWSKAKNTYLKKAA